MSRVVWTPAYIGIGSNIDDPIAQVKRGINLLASLPDTKVVVTSSLYRSAPLGPKDQPDFINAVVGVLTQLDASALLVELKALEKKLGRTQPIVRWGPRVIDFDLLVHGVTRVDADELKVPHPGIRERAFVLIPLQEIAADLDVPGVGRVAKLAQQLDSTNVVRL